MGCYECLQYGFYMEALKKMKKEKKLKQTKLEEFVRGKINEKKVEVEEKENGRKT